MNRLVYSQIRADGVLIRDFVDDYVSTDARWEFSKLCREHPEKILELWSSEHFRLSETNVPNFLDIYGYKPDGKRMPEKEHMTDADPDAGCRFEVLVNGNRIFGSDDRQYAIKAYNKTRRGKKDGEKIVLRRLQIEVLKECSK